MKVIEPGHVYQLQHLDGSGAGLLVFVNREDGTEHEGTQTQEILRALIDRTQHCDNCLRWEGNDRIIHHLRMALSLHEARAIERKTEKGEIKPETLPTGSDGHFVIRGLPDLPEPPKDGIFLRTPGTVDSPPLSRREANEAPILSGYRCNVPMCGESGVCEECRRRGAR